MFCKALTLRQRPGRCQCWNGLPSYVSPISPKFSLHVYRKEYVAMGMYHIAKAVAFLNTDCKLVPNPFEVPWTFPSWNVRPLKFGMCWESSQKLRKAAGACRFMATSVCKQWLLQRHWTGGYMVLTSSASISQVPEYSGPL